VCGFLWSKKPHGFTTPPPTANYTAQLPQASVRLYARCRRSHKCEAFVRACFYGITKARGGQPAGDIDVHSASLRAWWQTTQFCQNKIAADWLRAANC
ncbi:MAG: hypothetical protein LBK44_05425, partial [Spirochaetales bacterium]|nr:hypothetical protein [Spirochaetales bacterium]